MSGNVRSESEFQWNGNRTIQNQEAFKYDSHYYLNRIGQFSMKQNPCFCILFGGTRCAVLNGGSSSFAIAPVCEGT